MMFGLHDEHFFRAGYVLAVASGLCVAIIGPKRSWPVLAFVLVFTLWICAIYEAMGMLPYFLQLFGLGWLVGKSRAKLNWASLTLLVLAGLWGLLQYSLAGKSAYVKLHLNPVRDQGLLTVNMENLNEKSHNSGWLAIDLPLADPSWRQANLVDPRASWVVGLGRKKYLRFSKEGVGFQYLNVAVDKKLLSKLDPNGMIYGRGYGIPDQELPMKALIDEFSRL